MAIFHDDYNNHSHSFYAKQLACNLDKSRFGPKLVKILSMFFFLVVPSAITTPLFHSAIAL